MRKSKLEAARCQSFRHRVSEREGVTATGLQLCGKLAGASEEIIDQPPWRGDESRSASFWEPHLLQFQRQQSKEPTFLSLLYRNSRPCGLHHAQQWFHSRTLRGEHIGRF